MVEYFAPGSWQSVRCRGGCDNCTAAAVGGSLQRDLAAEARLLLATVQVCLAGRTLFDDAACCPAWLCRSQHSFPLLTACCCLASTLMPLPPRSACGRWAWAPPCKCCVAAGALQRHARHPHAEALCLFRTCTSRLGLSLPAAPVSLWPSRSQKMKPWMMDITAPDGTKLHGAGLQYSEGWWKVG